MDSEKRCYDAEDHGSGSFPFYPITYEEFTEVKNMIAVYSMFK